jgi:Type IV secretion-system coupling protein DNA-binding domain
MTVALSIVACGLVLLGLVLALRFIDGRAWRQSLVALRLHPPTGLNADAVAAWLGSLSALTHVSPWRLTPQPPVVIEICAMAEGIAHYLLVPVSMRGAVLGSVRAHLPGARIEDAPGYLEIRPRSVMAAEWRLTNRYRSLGSERATVTVTGLLASLQPLVPGEMICVQWILTGAGTPPPVRTASQESNPSWWRGVGTADSDELRVRRLKQREGPLLHAVGRLGVVAQSKPRALALFGRTWGTVRQLNAPGVQFVRRLLPVSVVADRLSRLSLPLTAWPLTLNAREAVGVVGLPVSERPLPGLGYHVARQVPPPHGVSASGVTVAMSNYPGTERPLKLSPIDRLRHLYVVGPVGVGKSTLLANLAVQDMSSGDGLALIDPKGDLATDVLERVPAHRRSDVIVADLADLSRPIGLNVLAGSSSEHGRELAADFVLSVLRSLWAQFWGPRTDDVLRAALLTLTHTHGAEGSAFTLVEVPELLTNLPFRRFVTEQPTVPASLRQFWAWFENVSDAERVVIVGPVLNKLRQFTTRTALRLSLGQARGLDLASVIARRQILLVTLARGVIGAEAAYLLGSLVVAGLWQATLARAALLQEQRRPFWLYLDEFHQVARLNIQLTDLLAEARGLGVGVVMANQYVSQLSPELRAAVLGTVRSQVVFQVEHDDAKLLEPRFAPTLTAADLSGLSAYEVALKLCSNNQVLAPMTGSTLPLAEAAGDPAELREASRQRFGMSRSDIEAAIATRLGSADSTASVGRRRRGAGA